MVADDGYLTMARIMEREWQSWYKANVLGTNPTGIQLLTLKRAFDDAFMAGFSGRYFNTEE